MYNLLLGIACIFICFILEIIVAKVFKKEGLFIWIAVASILANISVCKTVNILGVVSSLGNILFASNFLATDIISELYGSKESKKAVIMGLVSVILYIVATQLTLLFKPDITDVAHNSMLGLFSISLRVSIASVTMYFISNMLDVYLFEKIKEKLPGKMWVRSFVATIFSNCSENYLFAFAAFVGIYDINTILSIATIGSIIEILIAMCGTPFLYIAKKQFKNPFKHKGVRN